MTVRTLIAFSVLLAGPVSAQTTVGTVSFWDGLSNVQSMGKPNTGTYGQTFTVPTSDNVLQGFSFFLRDIGGGADLQFQGYVAAFDPTAGISRVTGPLLFQSAVRSGPTSASTFTRYDFDVGGLPLTSGSTYVAFLSASGHFASIPLAAAMSSWGLVPTNAVDHYDMGEFIFNNNGDDLSLLSTTQWSASFGGSDLAFELSFENEISPSAVPEPSTVLLTGTGLGILLLGMARRRRKA